MIAPDARGGAATPVFHFTHIDNLSAIAREGLHCDSTVQGSGLLLQEVGNQDIKELRRRRRVPVPPGGVVADYVPFYFAPRSPMMFAIHKGKVPTYHKGCDDVVYLGSTLGQLRATGQPVLLTDRNATLAVAAFATDAGDLRIDWDLMREAIWKNTDEYPDRREKRMAECLVHRLVEPAGIRALVTKTQAVADRVGRLVGDTWPVYVRGGWYF